MAGLPKLAELPNLNDLQKTNALQKATALLAEQHGLLIVVKAETATIRAESARLKSTIEQLKTEIASYESQIEALRSDPLRLKLEAIKAETKRHMFLATLLKSYVIGSGVATEHNFGESLAFFEQQQLKLSATASRSSAEHPAGVVPADVEAGSCRGAGDDDDPPVTLPLVPRRNRSV